MSDNSLLQDFIAETGEHLEETERNLLHLEQQPDDADTLNTIFRSVHTIKGSSEYLGLVRIAELSHKLESLLDRLRRGECSVDGNVVDLLMGCNDRIGVLVEELDKHQEEQSSIDDLVSSLKEVGEQAGKEDKDLDADEQEGAFEEEYDEELFGIFVEQLKDGLAGLVQDAGQLGSGGDDAAILEDSADRLVTLISSSNYMGYDELKGIYGKWSQSVDEAIAALKAGEAIDLDTFGRETMTANIEKVQALFPKVSFDTIEPAPVIDDELQPSEPETDVDSEPEDQDGDNPEMDQGLLADFIAETGEHLEETERNLLHLEQQPDDADTLNTIFRSVHTIKGSSEYLGMVRIAELSHTLESLLDRLRRGECSVDGNVVDLLMGCNDRIGVLVEELDKHQEEQSSIDDLVSSLKEVGEQAGKEDKDLDADEQEGAFEEEYDEELFGIFVEQLKDGLAGLVQDAGQLGSGGDDAAILEDSADRLVTLISSSNYMGYDELKGIYGKWSQSVDEAIAALKAGEAIDLDTFGRETMTANIEKVQALFPKVSFDTIEPAPVIDDEPQPSEPETDVDLEPEDQDGDNPEMDQGLLAEFIAETVEHLEEAERNLLKLEQQPDDKDALNEIFRSVHTIKGSSEYLGKVRIANLAHKLENLLDSIRQSESSVSSPIIELLAQCNERIGALVDEIEHSQEEKSSVDDLFSRLDSILTQGEDPSTSETTVEKLVIEDESGAIYGEEYDQELFGIFMEQFNSGLASLAEDVELLNIGESVEAVLESCKEKIEQLGSSANYMEYDELKEVYDTWLQNINDALVQKNDGDEIDIEVFTKEVMDFNINKAKSFFSNMRAVTEKRADSICTSGDDSTSRPEDDFSFPRQAMSANIDSITLSDIQGGDAPAKITPLPSSDDDNHLLDKLANAFDSRLGFSTEMVKQYYGEDVENNLFSENNEGAETIDIQAGENSGAQESDQEIVDIDNVESMLFSGSDDANTAEDVKLREQIPTAPTKRPDPITTRRPEKTEQRARYRMGRRQSDKFRDRMLKQSIRVDSVKIDALMNQVGELVVSRSGFNQLFAEMRELQIMLKQSQNVDSKLMQVFKSITNRINETATSLGRVTSELQENVMKVRMLPIAQLFSRYPRVVHDLVRNTQKKVNLEIYGEDTELDKKVIEQLADPLIHIIRNAVDHGIEDISERRQKGKAETGTIRMEAYPESNYVVIEISDDGSGIDIDQIRQRAMDTGMISEDEADSMRDEELLSFIMRPGFSTAKEVTHTSGRGVGMDVVKDNIENINGTIDIFSSSVTGAKFRIKIPLTLAIIPALLVRVADDIFTIPLSTVDETLRVDKDEISTVEGMEMFYLRENTVPLIRLREVFNIDARQPEAAKEDLFVVIVNTGAKQVGFVVDELKGRQEVVIKPLEDYLQEKSGFSGATILGDGNISLILDVFEMVQICLDQHVSNKKVIAT